MRNPKPQRKGSWLGCAGYLSIVLGAGYIVVAVILSKWSMTTAILLVPLILLLLRNLYYDWRDGDEAVEKTVDSSLCVGCGYSLDGLPQSVAKCPECGLVRVTNHDDIERLVHSCLNELEFENGYALTSMVFGKGCITVLRFENANPMAQPVRLEIQSDAHGMGGGCWVGEKLQYSYDYEDAWRESRKRLKDAVLPGEHDPVLSFMVQRLTEKAINLSGR